MPRAIAEIRREKGLRPLAQNLFVIEGPNKAADLRRAQAALLRENPGLSVRSAFKSGVVVTIPSGIGLATTDRVQHAVAGQLDLLQESALRLKMAESAMRAGFARSDENAKAVLQRLADPDFQGKLRRAGPEAAKLVPTALRNLRDRTDDNKNRETEIAKALEEALTEVDRLRRLAPQRPS